MGEKLSTDLLLLIEGSGAENFSVTIDMWPYGFFSITKWLENHGYTYWSRDGGFISCSMSAADIRELAELPEVKMIILSSERML